MVEENVQEQGSYRIAIHKKEQERERRICGLVIVGIVIRGTAVAQWLRCCATNRKVAGSISDGVIRIFH